MSFGWSLSDIALLVRLAYKTAEGARTACGEYDELTREVVGLHYVLNRLEREARKPDSFLNRPGETYKQELEPLSSRCKHILTQLDIILVKYNALTERERSVRKLWKQVRFGTGAVADVADLRSKIASCTASLSLFLNLVSLGTIGEVERKMNQAGGDLTDIKIAVNGITARLSVTAGREGSVLTAYTNDDQCAWRELRRGLVKDGFRGSLVRKHMKTIMAYVKELGSRGALDGIEELGCEEGLFVPGRHDDDYRSDRGCQATLATRNPKTTGSSSNQAQPIHQVDDSVSISSAASSDSSGTDDGVTDRPLPSNRQPYFKSAYETAGEDGQMESPGTESSEDSCLHTSYSADDMTGQESSSVDIREELPQRGVANQRKYKQENEEARPAEAWAAPDTNHAHTNSKAAYETTGRMDESDSSWSFFVDPCRSTRIVLYQISLENYQIPEFIADTTVIHPLPNPTTSDYFDRRRALSVIIRFKVRVLKLLGQHLQGWVERVCMTASEIPGVIVIYPHASNLIEIIKSCHKLLKRLDLCCIQSKYFTLKVADESKLLRTIQPEQIDALCVAFMVELTHGQLEYYSKDGRTMLPGSWALNFAAVVDDVEAWIDEYDRNCSTIADRLERKPG